MSTKDILERLIVFDTVSRNLNMALMHYIEQLLRKAGIIAKLISNTEGTKANLLASVGLQNIGGVILSSHTDVVPANGQNWSKPAFQLTCADGKYFGRGTADMKGFVAYSITAALKASQQLLKPRYLLRFPVIRKSDFRA